MAATTLLIGCGRLGSAILTGWRLTGTVAMPDLAILTPSMKPLAEAARVDGAAINPDQLDGNRRVVLAVKPAKWRAAASDFADRLPQDAVIVSVMAGVKAETLSEVFGARPVVRVMPTTAVAAGQGAATVWAGKAEARAVGHALFTPIATIVDVEDEALIDAATAMSGSGAAFAYAFVRALQRAGVAQGLTSDQARTLAESTVDGAMARLRAGEDADALIAEVASPGGTTEAGLKVLEPHLTDLIDRTVAAALKRTREIG